MSLLLKVNVNVKENDLEWLVTHKKDHPFFKKKIVWKDLKYTWNIRKQFSILNPEIQSWEKHYPEVRILWWMWMFKSTILHGLRHIRRSTPLHWVPFLIYVIITVILITIIVIFILTNIIIIISITLIESWRVIPLWIIFQVILPNSLDISIQHLELWISCLWSNWTHWKCQKQPEIGFDFFGIQPKWI